MMFTLFIYLLLFAVSAPAQQSSEFVIARLKYGGGGDWYNDPSAEVNLLRFVRSNTNINVKPEYRFVEQEKKSCQEFLPGRR